MPSSVSPQSVTDEADPILAMTSSTGSLHRSETAAETNQRRRRIEKEELVELLAIPTVPFRYYTTVDPNVPFYPPIHAYMGRPYQDRAAEIVDNDVNTPSADGNE